MVAAVLALGASVAWGVGDFLGGLKSRTLGPLAVLAVAQPVGLTMMVVVALLHWEPWPGEATLFAVPAAVLGDARPGRLLPRHGRRRDQPRRADRSHRSADPGRVRARHRRAPEPTPARRDRARRRRCRCRSSYEPGGESRPARSRPGSAWALLAAVAFGGYFIPMHEASEGDFVWAALVFRHHVVQPRPARPCSIVRPRLARAPRDLGVLACIGARGHERRTSCSPPPRPRDSSASCRCSPRSTRSSPSCWPGCTSASG